MWNRVNVSPFIVCDGRQATGDLRQAYCDRRIATGDRMVAPRRKSSEFHSIMGNRAIPYGIDNHYIGYVYATRLLLIGALYQHCSGLKASLILSDYWGFVVCHAGWHGCRRPLLWAQGFIDPLTIEGFVVCHATIVCRCQLVPPTALCSGLKASWSSLTIGGLSFATRLAVVPPAHCFELNASLLLWLLGFVVATRWHRCLR